MVCPRCIHFVKQILSELDLKYLEVELGYAVISSDQALDLEVINKKLEVLDLGLVRDQTEVLISEINKAIQDYLDDIGLLSHKLKLSEYVAKELGRNYHQLSKDYSQNTGKTIEQRFIQLRTNKVKELIRQGELNLSQIAVNVGYSSIHYLSGQFKKYTGISLSQYKKEWEASLVNHGYKKESFKKNELDKKERCFDCEDCDCGNKRNFVGNEPSQRSPNDQLGVSVTPWMTSVANYHKFKIYFST